MGANGIWDRLLGSGTHLYFNRDWLVHYHIVTKITRFVLEIIEMYDVLMYAFFEMTTGINS